MRTNKDSLPVKSAIGEIKPMGLQEFGMMVMDPEGRGHYRAGTGGITYNVRLGDRCMGFTGEKLQPGISTKYAGAPGPDAGPFGSPENMAYNIYCCLGNEVTVAAGPLAGQKGYVTGKVSGFGVTVDFDRDILEQMHGDERFYIKMCGVGLSIEGAEETVAVHNLSPQLFEKLGLEACPGGFTVPVKKILPGYLVGPGIGGSVIASCAEIMTDHGDCDREFGLEELCFGDLVAVTDLDTTSGRTFLEGAVTIGVIVSGDSLALGDGPGLLTILSSKTGALKPVPRDGANLKNYLGIK